MGYISSAELCVHNFFANRCVSIISIIMPYKMFDVITALYGMYDVTLLQTLHGVHCLPLVFNSTYCMSSI